jgi:hypothetical protein
MGFGGDIPDPNYSKHCLAVPHWVSLFGLWQSVCSPESPLTFWYSSIFQWEATLGIHKIRSSLRFLLVLEFCTSMEEVSVLDLWERGWNLEENEQWNLIISIIQWLCPSFICTPFPCQFPEVLKIPRTVWVIRRLVVECLGPCEQAGMLLLMVIYVEGGCWGLDKGIRDWMWPLWGPHCADT